MRSSDFDRYSLRGDICAAPRLKVTRLKNWFLNTLGIALVERLGHLGLRSVVGIRTSLVGCSPK